jgi:hypothetical protein
MPAEHNKTLFQQDENGIKKASQWNLLSSLIIFKFYHKALCCYFACKSVCYKGVQSAFQMRRMIYWVN